MIYFAEGAYPILVEGVKLTSVFHMYAQNVAHCIIMCGQGCIALLSAVCYTVLVEEVMTASGEQPFQIVAIRFN
jgi:hypothetical protein